MSAPSSALSAAAATAPTPQETLLSAPDGALHCKIFANWQDEDEAIKNGKFASLHDEEGVLAIFCDGSASAPYNEQGDCWTGCSAVYRKPGTAEWVKNGKPLPHFKRSGPAEVAGLDLALEVGLDKVAEHPAVRAISVVKVFTDYMPVLDVLQGLAVAGQDGSPATVLHRLPKETMQSIVDRDMVLARQYGVTVELYWVKSHKGVPGNKIADRVAKDYRPDRLEPDNYPVPSRGPARSKAARQQKAQRKDSEMRAAQAIMAEEHGEEADRADKDKFFAGMVPESERLRMEAEKEKPEEKPKDDIDLEMDALMRDLARPPPW
ncbi:uncharacterized protein BKCO1_9000127 [Diplodia corticola]|uniref:Uncharacterized protein n=1 Tax=Diplodia corticola TaxID=236234 RepID=A0A1J9S8F7_9PEZI|nr:uncharacterized protein BKCO1_9000127 [Diplodia corticola]OJD36791.1 hypothetical protein BKCO1_9000127 [Diplodia corticola]